MRMNQKKRAGVQRGWTRIYAPKKKKSVEKWIIRSDVF